MPSGETLFVLLVYLGVPVAAGTLLLWYIGFLWARNRQLRTFVLNGIYSIFMAQWLLMAIMPFIVHIGFILFSEEQAGWAHDRSQLVWWVLLVTAIILLNGSIMACALVGFMKRRKNLGQQQHTSASGFMTMDEEPCLRILVAALVTYVLVIPENMVIVAVQLFTGCRSCMWE